MATQRRRLSSGGVASRLGLLLLLLTAANYRAVAAPHRHLSVAAADELAHGVPLQGGESRSTTSQRSTAPASQGYDYSLQDDYAGATGDVRDAGLACNASLLDRVQHANALKKLAEDDDNTGIVIEFDLHEPASPCNGAYSAVDGGYGECTDFNRIDVTQCDAMLASNYTPSGSAELRGNSTKAARYFHPLQQIWSRRKEPCPILKLPPDRIALSWSLLSDARLSVRHFHAPLAVSSVECWKSLTQAEQSDITLTLSHSADIGLAAPGVQNATAQLCQLRYSSKKDFAVINSNTQANTSNEGFAFSCCYAETAGGEVTCDTSMSFSRWYDANNIAIFWGLFAVMFLAPLPFLSSLSPSKPKEDAKKNKTPAGSVAEEDEETDPEEQPEDPEHPLRVISSPRSNHRINQPEGDGADDNDDNDDDDDDDDSTSGKAARGLRPALMVRQFTSWQLLASTVSGNLDNYFVHNTAARPITDRPKKGEEREKPGCYPLLSFLSKYQVLRRLYWLVLLWLPLLLISLRAIAYRVSSTNDLLTCLVKVDGPTPWFLFLFASDYGLLVTYLAVCAFCLLANPRQLTKDLKKVPDTTGDAEYPKLFPVYPSGYDFPLRFDSLDNTDGDDNPTKEQVQGILKHIISVFKRFSLLRRVYQGRVREKPLSNSYPWLAVATPLAIVDLVTLSLIFTLVFVYNTPLGYVLIRWSILSGYSMTVLRRDHKAWVYVRTAVSVAWFISLTVHILLMLLVGTWAVATLKYIIVGVFFNIHTYIDYVIPTISILLYMGHLWYRTLNDYNEIQTSVVSRFSKAINEEQLVEKIASTVVKDVEPKKLLTMNAARLKIPTEVFDKFVAEHYPVRFAVLKVFAWFLAACLYIAALNATVLLNEELEKFGDISKTLALLIGSLLPKLAEKLFSTSELQNQIVRDTEIDDILHEKLAKVT